MSLRKLKNYYENNWKICCESNDAKVAIIVYSTEVSHVLEEFDNKYKKVMCWI